MFERPELKTDVFNSPDTQVRMFKKERPTGKNLSIKSKSLKLLPLKGTFYGSDETA